MTVATERLSSFRNRMMLGVCFHGRSMPWLFEPIEDVFPFYGASISPPQPAHHVTSAVEPVISSIELDCHPCELFEYRP